MEKYNFLSDEEPSEQQLSEIMKEVAFEAKLMYEKSEKLFWQKHNDILNKLIQEFNDGIVDERY